MSKRPLTVIAGAADKPLIIGDTEISCYVLEDETRVLTQRGMIAGLGLKSVGGSSGAATRTPRFFTSKTLKPFISGELRLRLENPILFILPSNNSTAFGYPATILVDVCEAILNASDDNKLTKAQVHVAVQCKILLRGLARLGVIALVDEATGYQEIREKNALATILDRYIDKEWQAWTKTFPDEFYELIFKLKGWGSVDGIKRPAVIGHYTNDLIYDRLAPGVLEELRSKNPPLPAGRRRRTHHQWFTPDYGHPKLKEHINAVTALMRASSNWATFKRNMNRAFPKINTTLPMDLGD